MAYNNFNSRFNGNRNGNSNSRNNNFHKNNQRNDSSDYVPAPYNFVPFSSVVHEYKPEQIASHSELTEGKLTGEIEYEITAETPIMVSKGVEKKGEPERFYQNMYGKYAIPGSTMRGLIRNNVQILGLCSMNDEIDDYALEYRLVAASKRDIVKKHEKEDCYDKILGAKPIPVGKSKISALLNVKAGYIAEENGSYVIYKSCVDSIKNYGEMNYYVLSERTIVDNYLSAKKNHGTFAYGYFERNGQSILNHELYKPFRKEVCGERVRYIGEPNRRYKPYYGEVSYSLKGEKEVIGVGYPGEKYSKKGYAISTGSMKEKKAIYIIPEIDRSAKIDIPEKDIKAFKIDFKKRENTLGANKSFFDLPKEGQIKPVFYIQINNRLYFGFTPRLRLFYNHTIKEGLSKEHKSDVLDYAKTMFGYSKDTESYKSRVSFSDAVIVGTAAEKGEVRLVLGEPKPTSYCDYVTPDKDGKAVTYNADNFRLRGVKQYWLKKNTVPGELTDNTKVQSVMKPLPEGTRFAGKVRFKNLTEDELGLLLWGLKLDENSLMNVGKAKAFGYGNISLKLSSVKKVNLTNAYNSMELCLNPWEEMKDDVDDLIRTYKEAMNIVLDGKRIEELPHIRQFFHMKDKKLIPEVGKTRYMNLKEYTSREGKVLPSIESIVKKSKENG